MAGIGATVRSQRWHRYCRQVVVPTANSKRLTATANRLMLAPDERSLQLDLVRLDRTVPAAGCVGSRDPCPSTPTQRAAAQCPEAIGLQQRWHHAGGAFFGGSVGALGWICCCCWITGRTSPFSGANMPSAARLSASRSQTSAICDRVTRALWSPNVRAISRHCSARRRYSSALLATAYWPLRRLDQRRQRLSVS